MIRFRSRQFGAALATLAFLAIGQTASAQEKGAIPKDEAQKYYLALDATQNPKFEEVQNDLNARVAAALETNPELFTRLKKGQAQASEIKDPAEREKLIADAARRLGKDITATLEKNGVSGKEYAAKFQDALNSSSEFQWVVTVSPLFVFSAVVVNPPPPPEEVGTVKQGLDDGPRTLGAADYLDSTDRQCGAAAGGIASATVDQLRASSTAIVAGGCSATAEKVATFSTPGKPATVTASANLRRHGAGWGVVLSACNVGNQIVATNNPQSGGSFLPSVWNYTTFWAPVIIPMHFDITQAANISGTIGAGRLKYWVTSYTVAGLSGIDCHSKAENISTTVK